MMTDNDVKIFKKLINDLCDAKHNFSKKDFEKALEMWKQTEPVENFAENLLAQNIFSKNGKDISVAAGYFIFGMMVAAQRTSKKEFTNFLIQQGLDPNKFLIINYESFQK